MEIWGNEISVKMRELFQLTFSNRKVWWVQDTPSRNVSALHGQCPTLLRFQH